MTLAQAIGLLAALALFCALQALFWIWRGQRSQRNWLIRERLQGAAEEDVSLLRQERAHVKGLLGRLDAMHRLQRALIQAGMTISVGSFLVAGGVAVVTVGLLATLISGSGLSGFVFSLLVVLLTWLYLVRARTQRLELLETQLPRALELMIYSLRAGHSLEESIRFSSLELPDPLGAELQRVAEQQHLGRPVEQALLQFGARYPRSDALRTLVEAVLVLKQAGGNVVYVMEQLILTLRSQAAYQARYRALTAEGRTSGAILGLLPVIIALTVLLIQPNYLDALVADSSGRSVLMVAVSLWLVGVLWLRQLVRPAL
ncbi:MAG: type II secretion system F family protein [Deltaproteobacteria bacterium]|nr:type II secretion system F family protein [Deltaproteobacteria bacterium]